MTQTFNYHLFTDPAEIAALLFLWGVGRKNYTLHRDKSVSVKGSVMCGFQNLTHIPIQFREVSGFFNCSNNALTSLFGAPEHVGEDFSCSCNKLVSLEFSPVTVGANFSCAFNRLTSLCHGPMHVGGDYLCYLNQLEHLEFLPQRVGGTVNCSHNAHLNDLQNIADFKTLAQKAQILKDKKNLTFFMSQDSQKSDDSQPIKPFKL